MQLSIGGLLMISIKPAHGAISRFFWRRREVHYLICAEMETKRAAEANCNVAWYQKQAAIARSNQLEVL